MRRSRLKGRRKKNRAPSGRNLDMFDQTANVARNAYRGVQYLKSVLNPELKYSDTTGTVTPGTTASIICCSAVAGGADQNTRNGISIKCHDIDLHGSIALDLANAVAVDAVRVMLYIDLQCKAAFNTAGQLLNTATDVLSLRNVTEEPRFVVLHDQVISVGAASKALVTFRVPKLWDGHIMYASSSGAVAGAANGQVMLLFLAKENTHPSTIAYDVRVRFYDN